MTAEIRVTAAACLPNPSKPLDGMRMVPRQPLHHLVFDLPAGLPP